MVPIAFVLNLITPKRPNLFSCSINRELGAQAGIEAIRIAFYIGMDVPTALVIASSMVSGVVCHAGYLEGIVRLVNTHPALHCGSIPGLHEACRHGNCDVIHYLLRKLCVHFLRDVKCHLVTRRGR